jgi:peroxiredoxin
MAIAKGRTSVASETPTLKVGDPAPDFTLGSHTGEEFTLSSKRGTNVVLAFYPFAFSGV